MNRIILAGSIIITALIITSVFSCGLFGDMDSLREEADGVTCLITYNSMGGSSVNPVRVTRGVNAVQPAFPVKSGFLFGGWYRESECTNRWIFAVDKVNGNITLYALWVPEGSAYSVNFIADGGTPAPETPLIVTKDSKINPPEAMTKSGYSFDGWYKSSAYTSEWKFETDIVSSNIILYAKWLPNYKVTFIANGGNPAPEPVYVAEGRKVPAPATMTKEAHWFVAWYKEAALETRWFFSSDVVTGNINLYAKWIPSAVTDDMMVWIEGGSFMMGSPDDEEGRNTGLNPVNEGPQHKVILTGFYMSRFLVTLELYEAVINNNFNPFDGNKKPMTVSNWFKAVEFCNLMSAKEGFQPCYTIDKINKDPNNRLQWDICWIVTIDMSANGYRLPTEAEWEYACRAGTTTPWNTGININTTQANFDDSVGHSTEVGAYPPNAWGLYDMHGNVWELCTDNESFYTDEEQTDPVGNAQDTTSCVSRGGSYDFTDVCLRSARRFSQYRAYTSIQPGIRLVRRP